jgi:hypothetical protein
MSPSDFSTPVPTHASLLLLAAILAALPAAAQQMSPGAADPAALSPYRTPAAAVDPMGQYANPYAPNGAYDPYRSSRATTPGGGGFLKPAFGIRKEKDQALQPFGGANYLTGHDLSGSGSAGSANAQCEEGKVALMDSSAASSTSTDLGTSPKSELDSNSVSNTVQGLDANQRLESTATSVLTNSSSGCSSGKGAFAKQGPSHLHHRSATSAQQLSAGHLSTGAQ